MLWFVSAAWRRYDVTRLCLAQRAHLCGELAERGIEASCVVVADDDNLDIAREFGFATVEQSNEHLGRKFNDGLEYACREGDAEWVCFIGSDDWAHVDLFDRLPEPSPDPPTITAEQPFVVFRLEAEVVTGREIAIVDLQRGRLRHCRSRGRYGVIPWILHRKALEPRRYRPIPETLQIGIDGGLIAGLGTRPNWVFRDPHDLCRVDFKSATNLNAYERVTAVAGYGEEIEPWPKLSERYPADLVEMARETSEALMEVAA